MKKTIKKLAALLLAGALAATAALPALADEDVRTYTVAQPSTENVVTDHTYKAYPILTAETIDAERKLGNVDWAENVSESAKAALLGDNNDLDALLKSLGTTNDSDAATKFAKAAFAQKAGLGTPVNIENGVTVLPLGYYLIVDESDPGQVKVVNWANLFLADGIEKVQIVSKVDAPSSEKKVQDINDSDEKPALTGLQDSADYDIGDEIPYTITATLPGNYEDYDKYYLAFKDDMSKGLTYKAGSAMIQYGSAEAVALADPTAGDDSSYTDGGHMWIWSITNLKDVAPGLKNGDKVTITYKAVLNSAAVLGSAGNPNKMRIEYSNNPNNTGDGNTNETPDDTNIVFTYKTVFNKVDGEKNPLNGADFKLEKKVDGNWVDVTTLGTNEHPTKTGDKNGNVFEFAGLDDGDYKLTETVTPTGYNTIDPIEFTITAEHDILPDGPTLTLTGTDGNEFTMTANVLDGSLTSEVVNNQGSTLPSTGGMGTTIFYVIGGILVLAAVIVLISKRRVQQ